MPTNFPSGLSSYGIPLPSGANLPTTTGKYFFVHSVTGSNGHSGDSPDRALATIMGAHALCTAAKGDTIILMPGHTEAVIAAGTITLSKSGVRVVSLGTGTARGTITYTTAAEAVRLKIWLSIMNICWPAVVTLSMNPSVVV